MEGEFTEESLLKFVGVIANKYKTELYANVSHLIQAAVMLGAITTSTTHA
jgi:hypothetical protein